MSNVTIHNTKQEWERGSSKQGRVRLPITGNTISVHKLLVAIGKLVRGKVSGRCGPRLGYLVHMAGHVVIHVAVSTVHTGSNILKRFGNDPSLPTEHTRDIRLEHVEGVVDRLLAEDNPRPALSVLGEHLAETEAGVLILEEDSTRIHEFLGVLGEHTIDCRSIIHVRQRVAMRKESIADLLQLSFNAQRLEEHNENAFLNQASRLGIRNGLLDGSKPYITVSPRGAEYHALESDLLLGADNSGDGAEAHIEIGAGLIIMSAGKQRPGLVAGSAAGELGHGEAGGVRHEESASLLEDLLELHLLVVLARELFGVGVEFLELGFVSLQFHLEGFQELGARGSFASRGGGGARSAERGAGASDDGGVALEETVNVSGGLEVETEVVTLTAEETKLALQFIAAADVAHVTTLEGGEVGIQIRELNRAQFAQVSKAVVSGVLVDDEGDILHVFRSKPTRHLGGLVRLKLGAC
mmetsp:Transcript_30639/g.52321  ORF Transcript_30639/g.52321 Transcript_30639/m.52321 type:complete len:468 (+) Transcript_30639:1438-2841(+)